MFPLVREYPLSYITLRLQCVFAITETSHYILITRVRDADKSPSGNVLIGVSVCPVRHVHARHAGAELSEHACSYVAELDKCRCTLCGAIRALSNAYVESVPVLLPGALFHA